MEIKKEIQNSIKETVKELYGLEVKPVVERPAIEDHGDYSSNVALVLAKQVERKPLEIAKKLCENLKVQNPNDKKSPKLKFGTEVAAPGFINFTLSEGVLGDGLGDILEEKADYGSLKTGGGKKVNVEFVSANPTGPLHIGNF